MSDKAKLIVEGKEYEFPVVTGSENEKAIDIGKLRQATGYITIDSGFKNTGSTQSAITFLDGEEGIVPCLVAFGSIVRTYLSLREKLLRMLLSSTFSS